MHSNTEGFDLLELAARYRPMLRLLDGSDLEVVNAAKSGALRGSFRAQRRKIFRAYLRSLRQDYTKLGAQIRALLLESDRDCPELSAALSKMELQFEAKMLAANIRLVMHAAGMGNVTASGLIECFEQLRQQAEKLSMPQGSLARAMSAGASA